LSNFVQQFNWWAFKPAPQLLMEQPGDDVFNHFIPLVANEDHSTLLAYTPVQQEIKIRNLKGLDYSARWFDPVNNKYVEANVISEDGFLTVTPPAAQDYVLVLKAGTD